jgi:hypothetical protein
VKFGDVGVSVSNYTPLKTLSLFVTTVNTKLLCYYSKIFKSHRINTDMKVVATKFR